jgi:CheY-like chemotaxis protein
MEKHPLKILIVDDDKDDAVWLSEVINEIVPGCTFYIEKDGIAALRFIMSNTAPDFVF